jgi:hypothetical protein
LCTYGSRGEGMREGGGEKEGKRMESETNAMGGDEGRVAARESDRGATHGGPVAGGRVNGGHVAGGRVNGGPVEGDLWRPCGGAEIHPHPPKSSVVPLTTSLTLTHTR